ncbi:MAG TPA: undecaprenyl-diphosphate phosphatase, partial [Nitrospirae bacterium]|nr:undecaprenyl-diphosphate phosphatase [Nitrospirota bacterium]
MIEAIVLGVIQGLTEFIPVSSTAHLILVPWLFGWQGDVNSLTFDIALHGGTLLALLVYFARDLYDMLFRRPWVLFLLIVATVPAAVVGVLFEDLVATTLRSPLVISASLVIFGLYMLISEKKQSSRAFSEIRLMDAVMIGMAQAVALIPGVSRSGITI